MTQNTIVAYFDTRPDAERAQRALLDAGLPASSISLLPEEGSTYARGAGETAYDRHRDEGGFWASLGKFFLPEEDRTAYAEGLSRGGVALSVTTEDAEHDRVADILERHGAVDLDEREAEWRREGWVGHVPDEAAAAMGGAAAAIGGRDRPAAEAGRVEEEVVPVLEERLRVGKRVVDRGRVRVRAYVVETPIEERVELRSQRARVERRPVERVVTGAEAAAVFQERSVEVEEREEEAVVSKEAVVLEEIVVRKEAEEREETVSDTVRRTEVEVEDDRAALDRDAARPATAPRPVAE